MKPKNMIFASGGAFSGILRRSLRRALRGHLSGAPSVGGGAFLARFAA